MKTPCGMGNLLKNLEPGDAEAVISAANQSVQWARIEMVLRGFGHDIRAYTISRHFRGLCRCAESTTPLTSFSSISEAFGGVALPPADTGPTPTQRLAAVPDLA